MIELKGVGVTYENTAALTPLSLRIAPGAFVALVGPNGSGKSTLLKAIAGHARTGGQVLLGGRPMGGYSPKERARLLAYFPQSRPLPNMDVHTLVSHGRFPHLSFGRVTTDRDREAVHRALEQTGMLPFARRPVGALSGGERQRAYLAMAVAQDADIILLDEPATFLDIRYQIEVLQILSALNGQGKTVLFAAHDLPSAFSCARRILLMARGALLCDGAPEQVAESAAFRETFGVGIRKRPGEGLFAYVLHA